MAEQDYQPYRSTLLSKAELAVLNRPDFRRVVLDIVSLWLQIVFAWCIAAASSNKWIACVAAMVVGNRYYSLFIIGHDGLHRRLHPRQSVNDFVNDVFVLGPLGAITRINRTNHMQHHGTLGYPEDPDAYKYAARWTKGPLAYLFSLTGIPFVYRASKNVYTGSAAGKVRRPNVYAARDVVIIVGWQVLLAVALTWGFGWLGYFVMWWIPVYIFTFAADITRVFCEHSTQRDDAALSDRLVMFAAGRIELFLFAPMNMNHHVAHHLWPSIPYYNLPSATTILFAKAATLHEPIPLQVRHSYVCYLMRCLTRATRAVA